MRISRTLLFTSLASAKLVDRAVDYFYPDIDAREVDYEHYATLTIRDSTGGSPSDPALPVSRTPLPGQSALETVLDSLQIIEDLTINSTWTIGNFTGESVTAALGIQTATTVLNAATYNATLACANIGNLSVTDAEQLGTFTQGLAYAVNASIATLISKKADFEKLGIATLIVPSLQGLLFGSYVFSETVLQKVPPELQIVSAALSSQIGESIGMGVACFNGTDSACITTIANPYRTLYHAIQDGTINAAPVSQAPGMIALVAAIFAALMAF